MNTLRDQRYKNDPAPPQPRAVRACSHSFHQATSGLIGLLKGVTGSGDSASLPSLRHSIVHRWQAVHDVSTAPYYIADVGRLAGSRTYEWAITTKSWIIMTFTSISIVSRCCILNLAGLPIVRVIPAPGYYAGCSGITKISGIVSTLNRDTNTSNFVFCHLKPKNIFCHSRSQDRPSRLALTFLIMLGAGAPVCTGFRNPHSFVVRFAVVDPLCPVDLLQQDKTGYRVGEGHP